MWEHDAGLSRMTDYQTAQLGQKDQAWTTRGTPAGRDGGLGTYAGAHQRWRDYHTDLQVEVVLRLEPRRHGADSGGLGKCTGPSGETALHRTQVVLAIRSDL